MNDSITSPRAQLRSIAIVVTNQDDVLDFVLSMQLCGYNNLPGLLPSLETARISLGMDQLPPGLLDLFWADGRQARRKELNVLRDWMIEGQGN